MKDAILLLLCAVALAQGIKQNPEQRSRPCNCNPSEAHQICQANYDNDNVLIAHENCNQFYKCANGKPVAYYCPDNLLYDPLTEQCEWPYNVECGDRPISEGPVKDEDSDSDNVSDTDNDSTCNCNPGEAPSICAAEGSNGILVAHQNCNQFYMCAEGKPVTFDCAPTLLYNPYKEECDWPQNVECGDRVISEPGDSNSSDDDNSAGTDGTCNCNPEEAPAICAAPGSESELIAHENCNKYYICNHGIPIAVSCFGDLLYNPYTKECDWPRNVDCGDRLVPETNCTGCNDNTSDDASCDGENVTPSPDGEPPIDNKPEDSESSDLQTPGDDDFVPTRPPGTCNCKPEEAPTICAIEGSDGVLVAHENCNEFYKCDHGKPVVLTCHGDLLYNPYTEQCDWPENVDCGDRVIPNPGVTNPPGTTPGATIPGNNCDPSEAPAICAADDSDGVLVAHEECNKFYKCSEGKPVALSCPNGLLFNPAKDQCDWPYNVDCGDRVVPDPDQSVSTTVGVTNPGVTNPPEVTRPPGTCNCKPEEAPGICAAENSDGVLVAHENCNEFYKCDHGKPVVLQCYGNLLYNPYTEQCDWPENVDCGDRVIPNPGVTNPPGTTPGATIPGNNCDPSEAPAICAADDSDGVLVAHEECNKFYKCSEGKPVALSCPNGLLFNPAKDQCDWPYNVDCGDRVVPDQSVSTTVGVTNPGVTNPPEVTRPPGTCNCKPEEAPGICAAENSDGVLVAHENCNEFYKCDHGKPVVLQCYGNLLYNPYTEQCDWPENVDCGDRVIPDPDQIVSTTVGATNPPGVTRPPGTCNCKPEEAPGICAAEDSDGVLVAHENCNEFYKCDHGKPVVLQCYGNLLYNPYTEQCDWPENVDCGDRVIPDPNQSDSSTAGVTNPGVTNPGATNPPGNNCDPSEAPAICAADDSEGVLVAHEHCNKFFVCNGGKPVVLSCPEGLLFNPAKDQCDWPFNVDCGDRVIPDPGSPELDPPGDGIVVPTRPPGTCNCKPEEAPGICAAEDSDGVLVAHENCNAFYKCDHGKPVVFQCYGNLLYNPYTEQCDWPENVNCGDRVIPDPDQIVSTTVGATNPPGVTRPPGTCNCKPEEAPGICAAEDSDGVLVAHENCNAFYKCDHGKPVVFQCYGNLLYNPYTEQCDWPENVDCGDRVIPDPDQPVSSTAGVTNPPEVTRPPGTCNCKPEEAPGICAAEDSDGVLVAHENCNAFYKCDHGKPVVFQCNGNLLYNPYTEQCDWPENVDCGDRVIPDPDQIVSTTVDATNPPGVTRPPGTCNCKPEEAPGICAAEDSDGVLVAHENCNAFYKCDHGKPVVFQCNGNLLYNPYTEQCDWPENVDCGDRVIPDPDQIVSTTVGATNPPGVTRPPGTCNCKPEEAPGICAAEDSDGVLVAHENCNAFYKCDHGKPVVFQCNGNLLYNPYTEQCDWPENVDCGDRVIPDPDQIVSTTVGATNPPGVTRPPGTCNCKPEEAPGICAAEDSDGVLVAHENCNAFYKCDHGKPVVFQCNGNLLYNPYTEQCDWPENVDCGNRVIPDPDQIVSTTVGATNPPGVTRPPGTCNCKPEEAPGICAAEDSDGVLVAHENCNAFYKCDHGKPVVLQCYGNLLYNPYTEQCDWPENVDCGDRVIPDPDQIVSTTVGATNPPGVTRPPGTCNCKPEEAPGICAAEDSDGVLVAHENCNAFYKCDHGKPVVFQCNGNLLYNPYTEQCDWPENVDCGDRVIPDPDQIVSTTVGATNPPGVTRPPGTCNCKPEEAPGICAAEDSDGVLVAHENCNAFYKCDHGKPVVLQCYGNLLYNPYTEQCDWPENVDCGDRVIPDPDQIVSTTVGATNPPGVTRPPGTCNCKPEEAPGICAAEDSDGVLVAHENCNAFYKCDHGKPVVFQCYGNLLYNPYTEQCDWPENVDCGDRVIPDPDQPVSSTAGVTNPPEVTRPPGTCNCKPEEAPGICAAEDSDGVLVAHENCNAFYKCDHGKPVVFQCYGNLLYNPYTEQCDWPENVDCGDRVIPDPNQSDSSTVGVTNPGVTNPGVTNPPGNNCDPSEAPAICAADDSEGVLVAHEHCNKFFVCNGGKPVVLSCPEGLLFNPAKDQCDWPFNVDCGDRVIPDPGSPELDPPGDGVVVPTRPPGTCNCKPEEAPGICAAEDSDGVLVAHENCNAFYKCDHGKPVVFQCYGNLLYNPYTEQCDWPENVDCGDRVIPDPNQPVSSTAGVTNPGVTNPGVTNPPGNNCDPSEAPAICAADDSEGVLVAHEHCNKFFVCNGGKPVVLSCPEGLLFNPAKDQCDWPFNVDCGDRVIPDPGSPELDPPGDGVVVPTRPPGTCNCKPEEAPGICAAEDSDGVLVAHENCNAFYKCDHGKPVVFQCYGNLLYNPYTEQCDWPENVDCGDRVIPDPDQPVSSTAGVTNPGVTNPGVTNPPGNNCDPSEAPAICAADDSEGVLVAHEHCNKFFVCNGGKPVVLSCPEGLLFNPAKDQCDWPFNVDCGDRVIPDPGSPELDPPGDGVVVPTRPPGTCNCKPEEAPGICAAEDSDGVLVAHENCNAFYKCDHGKPVVFQCYGNLLYNPYTEQCDWPENVDCGDRVIPDPNQSDSSTAGVTNPGVTNPGATNPPGNNCDPSEAPAICAADDSEGVLVAHEHCNKFFVCNGGKPVVLSCPEGLLFNPAKDQCDWPFNVDCGDRVIPDPGSPELDPPGDGVVVPTRPPGTCNCKPEEAPGICAAEDSDGVLVAHENCNAFYKCDHGKPVVFQCYGNLLYNPYTEQCDWPENVDCGDRVIPDPDQPVSSTAGVTNPPEVTRPPGTCNCKPEEAPGICAAENSDGVLIAHENCNEFYKCDHGKPVVLQCYGNLLYNPYTEQCDWPENVDCGDRVIPDPDQPASTAGVTNPPEVTRPPGTCNCKPEEAPGICAADDSDGVLVAHENCNAFYKCDHGKPVVLQCYGNLLYNPYTEQCDWPENVDCGDRVIPDPDQPASTAGVTNPPEVTRPPGTCNCKPEEAPGICAADDSDGVLVAHENCNAFYKCDHGKPVVLQCYGNLLYNPYTEQCDWPENVDCGDRVIPDPDQSVSSTAGVTNPGMTNPPETTPGAINPGNNCDPSEAPTICAADDSDGVLVAHENCNQFYKCSEGKPVALSCPEGLLFNPAKDQCDWPSNVECGNRAIPDSNSESSEISVPGDHVTSQPPEDSNETDDCSGSGGENSGQCNCDPDQAPSICALDNSEGALIAHEYCDRFYRCANGKPVTIKCAPGTLFNPLYQSCDWPQNVDCGDRIIPEPEDDVNESKEDEEPGVVRPCNCNPEEAPAICAVDGSNGIHIAHENCNQFYKCDHGKPVAFSCSGFLLYDPVTESCDWPGNVDCGDRVIPDPGVTKPWSNENDSDTEEDNNNIVNDDPSQAPAICASFGSDGVLVAHENCNQYYICAGGVPIAQPCNNGLLFNPNNQHCDWPSNVVCGDRIIPDDCACNPRNAPALCSKPGSQGKLIAHESCNQFYICSHSVPVAQTCPEGLFYNIDREFCDWPQNVNCDNRMQSYMSLNKHSQSRQTLRN